MNEMSKSYELVLVSINNESPSPSDIEQMKKICEEVHVFKLGFVARFWSLFIGVFLKRPFQVSLFYSNSIQKKIDKIIDDNSIDIIYSQLVRAAEYIKNQPHTKVVDFMDAFSWGMNKRAQSTGPFYSMMYKWESELLKLYENHIFNKFDFHTIISEQDRDRMDIPLRDKIRIVPNGVDTQFFTGNDSADRKYQICFVGNMGYLPNVKAVEYIAEEIMPQLVAEHEDFKLLIAGARPTASVKKLNAQPGIDVTGWVDDIRDAYNDAKIFIAPIFIGIGQQNKILEAMSMGVPCITTEVVNNSIGAKPGESILIADTAEEYINAINYLLDNTDKYDAIRERGKIFVNEKYSWESQSKELFDIFAL